MRAQGKDEWRKTALMVNRLRKKKIMPCHATRLNIHEKAFGETDRRLLGCEGDEKLESFSF